MDQCGGRGGRLTSDPAGPMQKLTSRPRLSPHATIGATLWGADWVSAVWRSAAGRSEIESRSSVPARHW